jgi:hypothetical protein
MNTKDILEKNNTNDNGTARISFCESFTSFCEEYPHLKYFRESLEAFCEDYREFESDYKQLALECKSISSLCEVYKQAGLGCESLIASCESFKKMEAKYKRLQSGLDAVRSKISIYPRLGEERDSNASTSNYLNAFRNTLILKFSELNSAKSFSFVLYLVAYAFLLFYILYLVNLFWKIAVYWREERNRKKTIKKTENTKSRRINWLRGGSQGKTHLDTEIQKLQIQVAINVANAVNAKNAINIHMDLVSFLESKLVELKLLELKLVEIKQLSRKVKTRKGGKLRGTFMTVGMIANFAVNSPRAIPRTYFPSRAESSEIHRIMDSRTINSYPKITIDEKIKEEDSSLVMKPQESKLRKTWRIKARKRCRVNTLQNLFEQDKKEGKIDLFQNAEELSTQTSSQNKEQPLKIRIQNNKF